MKTSRLRLAFGLFFCLASVLSAQQVAETEHEAVETIEPPPASERTHVKPPNLREVESRLIAGTNEFRASQQRPKLAENEELAAAASKFAQFMARADKYGHTADGRDPSRRAEEQGYEACIVAENIAYQYRSTGFTAAELSRGFLEGWKKSPGHRRNLLDADLTEIGIAVAFSRKTDHFYAVQLFGRPRSASIRFQIANESDATVHYRLGERLFVLPERYTRTHELCRPGMVKFVAEEVAGEEETEGKKAAEQKSPEKPATVLTPQREDRFVITAAQGAEVIVRREMLPDTESVP